MKRRMIIKRQVLISLALALMLATIGWRIGNNRQQIALPVAAATINSDPIGRIINIENDNQTSLGKLLYPSDTIQPKNGANVVVLCHANGETWDVPSGKVSSLSDHCPPIVAKLEDCDPKNGCYPNDPRGPLASCNTPDIISPYDTTLLNNKPPLSWYAVKGVTSYTVSVRDITGSEPNREWTDNPPKSASGEIQIDYPFTQALQPEGRYKLIVEARTESNKKRITPRESMFTMLSQEKAQQVRNIVGKIDKLDLSKEEKVLLDLYSVYRERNLIAEAREKLEELVKEGSQTAQVYRRLGDIYLRQGLFNLAKTRYDTTVKFATTAQDFKELEAAQKGLKEINAVMARQNEAAPCQEEY